MRFFRDAKSKAVTDVTYFQENIFYKSERDFDSTESNGASLMVRLPPGVYELPQRPRQDYFGFCMN